MRGVFLHFSFFMLPHSASQKRQKTVCLKHPMPLTVARKAKVSRRFTKQHFRLDICKIRNPFKCQSHGSGHPRCRHRGAALHHIFLPASSRRAGNETFSRRDKIRFADAVRVGPHPEIPLLGSSRSPAPTVITFLLLPGAVILPGRAPDFRPLSQQ